MQLTKKQIYFGVGGLALFVVWAKLKRGGDADPGESIITSVKEAVISAVDDIRSILDRKKWTQAMYASIRRVLPEVPHAGRLLIIAQAVQESGWASSGTAAKQGFNYWNITAGSKWTGDVYVAVNGDRSYQKSACKSLGRPMDFKDAKGRAYCKIDQRWRKWPSLDAAVKGYWDFISANYGAAKASLLAGDARGFVHNLAEKGYFDPAVKSEYLTNVQSILKRAGGYVA